MRRRLSQSLLRKYVFRVSTKGRVVWCAYTKQARLQMTMSLQIMRENKSTGLLTLTRMRNPRWSSNGIIDWLNGHGSKPVLIRAYRFVNGEIVERMYKDTDNVPYPEYYDPVVHPTPAHAAWLHYAMQEDVILELLWRAPDWKSFWIAAKLSNFKVTPDNYKMTQDICKYMWSWAHRLRVDVDADSKA